MYKKEKLIKFLRSVVAIPLFAMAVPLSGTSAMPSMTATISQTITTNQTLVIITPEEQIRKDEAAKIDAYFASRNSPLEGYGAKFVEEAYKNDIDYRLLPAIATRESNAGKNACKSEKAPNNDFGWFSCKKGFSSIDESIEYISKTLAGNNPNAPHYNDDMTTVQILKKYNPPSIVRNYSSQVIKIMKTISSDEEIV